MIVKSDQSSQQDVMPLDAGKLTKSEQRYELGMVSLLAIFLFSTSISIAATNIAYGLAMALWIVRMLARRRYEVEKTPFDRYILAFIFAEAVATLFAYDQGQSLLYMYRRVSLLPIIYLLASNIRSERLLKILFGSMIASMIFVALWSLRDVAFHLDEYVLFQRRLNEFQMYMTAGGLMMIALLLVLPFVIHPQTPRNIRILGIIALVPLSVNLLFTFTRSAWLGFIAGTLVIAFYRSRKLLIPFIAAIIGIVVLSPPEIKDRMLSIFDPTHYSNAIRLQMWETGWKIFQNNPIVGIGDIGIERVWDKYGPPQREIVGHLHNNVIMWLVTLGSLGFIIIVLLFVKIWMTIQYLVRQSAHDWLLGSISLGCLAVLAGFHINGLFEWNFGDAEVITIVWSIIGITLGSSKFIPGRTTVA